MWPLYCDHSLMYCTVHVYLAVYVCVHMHCACGGGGVGYHYSQFLPPLTVVSVEIHQYSVPLASTWHIASQWTLSCTQPPGVSTNMHTKTCSCAHYCTIANVYVHNNTCTYYHNYSIIVHVAMYVRMWIKRVHTVKKISHLHQTFSKAIHPQLSLICSHCLVTYNNCNNYQITH